MKTEILTLILGLAALGATATGDASADREPLRVTLTFDDGLKDHILVAAPPSRRTWTRSPNSSARAKSS